MTVTMPLPDSTAKCRRSTADGQPVVDYAPDGREITLTDGSRAGGGNWLLERRRGEIIGDGLECLVNRPRLDWVVAGCESGDGARPAAAAWFRVLRDECQAAGVAYFLKQAQGAAAGDVADGEPELHAVEGKKRKRGGIVPLPVLDGEQHAAFPPLPPTPELLPLRGPAVV